MTVASSNTLPNFSAPEFNLNQNGATWQWHSWEGLPYLTCSWLNSWPHGFFTQNFAPKTPSDLVEVLNPQARVYRVKQVHGARVVKTDRLYPVSSAGDDSNPDLNSAGTLTEADGIITEKELEAVWVCSADCAPVLIADAKTGQVAAVHAGWRGTAARIVPEAIAMFAACGSKLENLRVAMGPAIAGDVYQVSIEVAVQLGATIAPESTDAELLEFLHQLPEQPILDDPEPGKVRLDVRRFNALQLEKLGIKPHQVAIAPYCTYSNPTHFFSYRRDQLKKVQWSGIVSTKNS
ncbi:MAG TPA: peptidoglycan editing factor PgeF [Kamptonema sp.]|nr:peptidoglycan editing factor PgeF [Kamptonema sp.]